MKPKGSGTFLKNDEAMLWIGLLTRDTGIPASRRLNIRDEVTALSFDLAVSLRLLTFDNERGKTQAKNIAFEVGRMLSGDISDDYDILGSAILGDKYADENTEVW